MAIVVNPAFGSVMDVSMSQNVYIDVPAMTTQSLDFAVRDRNYNVISNPANISFVMSLMDE